MSATAFELNPFGRLHGCDLARIALLRFNFSGAIPDHLKFGRHAEPVGKVFMFLEFLRDPHLTSFLYLILGPHTFHEVIVDERGRCFMCADGFWVIPEHLVPSVRELHAINVETLLPEACVNAFNTSRAILTEQLRGF